MAAPVLDRTCAFCLSPLKNKHYRSLESKFSIEQYSVIFTELRIRNEGATCGACTNKLNRILKLRSDESTVLSRIQSEKEQLFKCLLEMPGTRKLKICDEQLTPQGRSNKKRPLAKTPSGATPKSKRPLFLSPRKKPPQCQQPKTADQSTQTASQCDFDVKVCVKYQGNERSRIITDEVHQLALKALVNRKSEQTILKHLAKSANYKNAMTQFVAKDIVHEVSQMPKRRETALKANNVEDLLSFEWRTQAETLEQKLPTLISILKPIFGEKFKYCLPHIVVGVSVLLYGRCQQLNLLQYILGLTLDRCGLTKEGLSLVHDIGLSVSYSSVHKKRKGLMKRQEDTINRVVGEYVSQTVSGYQEKKDCAVQDAAMVETTRKNPIEVIGDNLDICIAPAKMTMEKQRRSLHWFLTMVKEKRVTYEDLNVQSTVTSQTPILDISSHKWIPSNEQVNSIQENFIFHVSKALMKYIEFLEPVKDSYPDYIEHLFIDITKEKSVVLNCDLIDASENSSQGMIEILQKVHELTVPHTQGDVIEKVVFGGDVLTNERAFSAQEAMQNNKSPFDSLCGVIHRPEGLHRQFNFLQVIYQLFYKESSAKDHGSLYQLRNWINRRDVSGPKEVVQKFRPHQQFIDDVLDAYLVGTFLDLMDMEDVTSHPRTPPLLSLMSPEQKVKWLNSVSRRVIESMSLNELSSVHKLRCDLECLTADDQQLEAMKDGDIYRCALCDNNYTCLTWFKKHLAKKHHWKFHKVSSEVVSTNAVKHFLFMALLLRDTSDSYRMGDGERIVRNAYFEWLYDTAVKHSKYKIWLWRMISYVISLLGVKNSFEYMWNMTVNLKGGICNNIPNDNCVELQVNAIKKELNTQGANKSYQSAKMICMTTQVVDKIWEQLVRTTKTVRSKRERPTVEKSKDIIHMVEYLRQQGPVTNLTWSSFSSFKDPLQCIDADDLHAWINTQKKIASILM